MGDVAAASSSKDAVELFVWRVMDVEGVGEGVLGGSKVKRALLGPARYLNVWKGYHGLGGARVLFRPEERASTSQSPRESRRVLFPRHTAIEEGQGSGADPTSDASRHHYTFCDAQTLTPLQARSKGDCRSCVDLPTFARPKLAADERASIAPRPPPPTPP